VRDPCWTTLKIETTLHCRPGSHLNIAASGSADSATSVADDFFSERTTFAFAHPENKSSLHVMTKLGFTFLRNETLYGLDAPLYSLETKNQS
jgi:hypothetical protein